jgi:hypothetical protein
VDILFGKKYYISNKYGLLFTDSGKIWLSNSWVKDFDPLLCEGGKAARHLAGPAGYVVRPEKADVEGKAGGVQWRSVKS